MYERNEYKDELILLQGQTEGLPLFEQEKLNSTTVQHPDWLWSGNSIKAEIYNKMKEKFALDSLIYLNALVQLGGAATDHEIKELFSDVEKWPLHIVAARRNYFTKSPFYLVESFPGKTKLGPSGKPNTIWYLNYKNLYQIIA
ncbi:MAG: hypothetical protein K9J12_12465 [Melioribacteraceae bacterium]|nr:hypothetical protein [Melioribacteraceae bacterium]MCF8265837.1 hypothetical protein [Melioribacteraceae bacterium]MCF8414533.1 hypothetical protein [Melioribacteraceae bacterium]